MQLSIFDNTESASNNRNRMINSQAALEKIAGLIYVPDFITTDEHIVLWEAINKEPWLTDIKRRVQHYGWKYDYKARAIDYSMYLGELPLWAKALAEKVYLLGFTQKLPDQVIINEYQPGQGITNHVDCEPCFGETVISLSLGSSCVMDFINLKSRDKIEVVLEPRSLVVISGEARHNWTHGIAPRKFDYHNGIKFERRLRISLTFRDVVLNSCELPKGI